MIVMDNLTRNILRGDAVFDALFGVLLLASPLLGDLFRALELPVAQPELYMQFAGGLLLVCAYLLWLASSDPALARPVALSIGLVNLAGVVLIWAWISSGALGVGSLGSGILLGASTLLSIFAIVELRYALFATLAARRGR
jgi:hypothetical protein